MWIGTDGQQHLHRRRSSTVDDSVLGDKVNYDRVVERSFLIGMHLRTCTWEDVDLAVAPVDAVVSDREIGVESAGVGHGSKH